MSRRMVLVLSMLLSVSASTPGFAETSLESLRETRDLLSSSLDSVLEGDSGAQAGRLDPALVRNLTDTLRAYRTQVPENSVSLKDAPFPTFVLKEKMTDLFHGIYESQWKEQHHKIVEELPLELLFDAFLQQIVDGTVSGSSQKAADRIGKCLARKALKAAGAQCSLDASEKLDEPGILPLLLVKASCHVPLASQCRIRRTLYNAAKSELIAARKTPETRERVNAEFEKKFPSEFRNSFLTEIGANIARFPGLVAVKFGAGGRPESPEWPEWSTDLPVIDTLSFDSENLTLHEFIAGFRMDLKAAAVLAQSPEAEERAMAGGLFYAAANRLLLLTGGNKARTTGPGAIVLEPSDRFDPAQPQNPPKVASEPFGGWAFDFAARAYGNWDWAAYSGSDTGPFLLFPNLLSIGRNAVATLRGDEDSRESLDDVTELLEAAVDFLKLTAPKTALGNHFGDSSAFQNVIDPASPMVFPNEGRQLGVGLLAAALKNLMTGRAGVPGHLDFPDPSQGTSLKLGFHEWISRNGRSQTPVRLAQVSNLLLAVDRLRGLLEGAAEAAPDPVFPAELIAVAPKLGQAVQVGALVLAAESQAPDGTFFERFGVVQSASEAQFGSFVSGLRALTRAYNRSRMLPLRLSIRLGWEAFDRAWKSGQFSNCSYRPAELLDLVALWSDTKKWLVRDLAEELNWAPWSQRMDKLEHDVLGPVQSGSEGFPVCLPGA